MESRVHPWLYSSTLQESSRLASVIKPILGQNLTGFLVLGVFGCLAALAWQQLRLGLGIPGHAIVKAVVPLGLGIALVPWRGGGTIQSLIAGLLTLVIPAAPGEGSASRISLICLGPVLDLCLLKGSRGRWLLLCFGLAGLLANLLAFLSRLLPLLLAGEIPRRNLTQGWWTYPLCGFLAGMMAAAAVFKTRASPKDSPHGNSSGH
ncbi:MAG: hypothetical protein EXR99_00020 [Gemmataceae bacterium]|nr:hypothetical protein [Gemmataceae bacterium]